jgi:hypothetical protein
MAAAISMKGKKPFSSVTAVPQSNYYGEEINKSKDDTTVHVEDKTLDSPPSETALPVLPQGEAHMTKAKWLAAIALTLAYTTAFQQGACIGGILKSIDEKLGTLCFVSNSVFYQF